MALKVEIIKPGDGKTFPKAGQTVSIHFVGKLPDGTVALTSEGQEPFKIKLGSGELFKEAEDALMKMSLGEKVRTTIDANAFAGNNPVQLLPPNTALVFEVELVKIE